MTFPQAGSLPSAPGAVIGYTKRGPIRLQAGGDGEGNSGQQQQQPQEPSGEAQGDGNAATQGNSQPNSAQGGTSDPGDTQQGQTSDGGTSDQLPQWARDQLTKANNEAANYRTQLRQAQQSQQDTLDAIANAIGAKEDDSKDPEKLTQQLTSEQGRSRDAMVRLALHENTDTHGGDPKALSDSRSFLAKVGELDTTADDFQTKVVEAAKTAVQSNPKLGAASQAQPPRSGAEFTGGSGGQQNSPPSDMNAYRKWRNERRSG